MVDGETFLVVEDDIDVLTLLQRALERPGRLVLVSPNGAGALEHFDRMQGGVTLVIADVVLPDISGADVVRRMLETRPSLAVLFISGYSSEIVADYTAGLSFPFLRKPFTVGQLRAAVAEALGRDGA